MLSALFSRPSLRNIAVEFFVCQPVEPRFECQTFRLAIELLVGLQHHVVEHVHAAEYRHIGSPGQASTTKTTLDVRPKRLQQQNNLSKKPSLFPSEASLRSSSSL